MLGYDEYNRLFVMFHAPIRRIWKGDKDFEFFHLKYQEKVQELLENEKEISDKKFMEFLKKRKRLFKRVLMKYIILFLILMASTNTAYSSCLGMKGKC